MNKDYYESLSKKEHKIIEEKWSEHSKLIEENYKEQLEISKQEMIDGGIEFIEADEKAFKEASEDVWRDIAPEAFGEGVYEKIQELR